MTDPTMLVLKRLGDFWLGKALSTQCDILLHVEDTDEGLAGDVPEGSTCVKNLWGQQKPNNQL